MPPISSLHTAFALTIASEIPLVELPSSDGPAEVEVTIGPVDPAPPPSDRWTVLATPGDVRGWIPAGGAFHVTGGQSHRPRPCSQRRRAHPANGHRRPAPRRHPHPARQVRAARQHRGHRRRGRGLRRPVGTRQIDTHRGAQPRGLPAHRRRHDRHRDERCAAVRAARLSAPQTLARLRRRARSRRRCSPSHPSRHHQTLAPADQRIPRRASPAGALPTCSRTAERRK